MISLKKTLKAIATRLSNEADYIVEQGTEDIWTYRKWNSGIAECWGTKLYSSLSITHAWANVYELNGYHQFNYPSGLFVEIPAFFAVYQTQGGALLSTEVSAGASQTSTPRFGPTRPSSATSSNVTLGMHAIGRWK